MWHRVLVAVLCCLGMVSEVCNESNQFPWQHIPTFLIKQVQGRILEVGQGKDFQIALQSSGCVLKW